MLTICSVVIHNNHINLFLCKIHSGFVSDVVSSVMLLELEAPHQAVFMSNTTRIAVIVIMLHKNHHQHIGRH